MNRLLEEPEVFTVRAEGATYVILSYTAETAEALVGHLAWAWP